MYGVVTASGVACSMYPKSDTFLAYNREKFVKVPIAKGRAIKFQKEGPFPGGGRDQVM